MSTDGGASEALISVLMLPFVFQRRDNAAVKFVSGTLERFVALKEISSRVNRVGRGFARSSRFTAQLLTLKLPTDAPMALVLSSSAAKPLVTDCRSSRIASEVFVVA